MGGKTFCHSYFTQIVSFRIVDMDTKRGVVDLRNPKNREEPRKAFTFDAIYDWE